MDAGSTVPAASLVTLAARWGRKPHAVRAAVNAGLLPPARRVGRGRARGSCWHYPAGNDRTLRTIFRLQNWGYRGDTLRFALWWLGLHSWTQAVGDYVLACFETVPQASRTRWLKTLVLSSSPTPAVAESGDDGDAGEDVSLGDVILTDLESQEAREAVHRVADVCRSADQDAGITDDEVRAMIAVFAAGLGGFFPEDVGATAFPFLERYLPPAAHAVMRAFHTPEFVSSVATSLRDATSEQYDDARAWLRHHPQMRRLTREAGRVLSPTRLKLPSSSFARLGPWRYPGPAIRALLVGTSIAAAVAGATDAGY